MQYWTFIDALYFCVVLVSTVGYGTNLVPDSPASRIFSIYFAVVGIFVFAVLSRTVAALITGAKAWWTTFRHSMTTRLSSAQRMSHPQLKRQLSRAIPRRRDFGFIQLDPGKMLLVRVLRVSMGFIAFNYVSAATFTATEDNVCPARSPPPHPSSAVRATGTMRPD